MNIGSVNGYNIEQTIDTLLSKEKDLPCQATALENDSSFTAIESNVTVKHRELHTLHKAPELHAYTESIEEGRTTTPVSNEISLASFIQPKKSKRANLSGLLKTSIGTGKLSQMSAAPAPIHIQCKSDAVLKLLSKSKDPIDASLLMPLSISFDFAPVEETKKHKEPNMMLRTGAFTRVEKRSYNQ